MTEPYFDSALDALLSTYGMALPDVTDTEALTGYTLSDALGALWNTVLAEAASPLHMLGMLLGVILLSALAGSLRSERTAPVYDTVCVLCASGIAVQPVTEGILRAGDTLAAAADFLLAFSGILGGVLAAGGGITSAAVWQAGMAGICELFMQVSAQMIFPVLGMLLAMSIVDAVNPMISLSGIISLFHKAVCWVLGLMMAGFIGMLSVQSTVAAAAARAGTKAAKFVISGAVPVIGGAVSDAYTAVLGSMGIVRAGVGMTGILALLALLLPVVVRLGLLRGVLAAASAGASLFDVPQLSRLLGNMEKTAAAGFSAAVGFSVMCVFSVAVILLIGGMTGGG